LLEQVNDSSTRICLHAEREFLRLLQADCNQPVGVFAVVNEDQMTIRAQLFESGVTSPREALLHGDSNNPTELAAKLFRQINGH